jgi:hypothetical protein
MRYNDNEENDLLSEISDLLSSEETSEETVEIKVEKVEEDAILIPLDYRIFSTDNGLPTGKREPVDVYKCDRNTGIIPIGKARKKANLMQQAFKDKTFFVSETASKILPNGKITTVENIVYQTK